MIEKRWNHLKGDSYEEKAKEYLIKQNCTILEQNFRSKRGEIDLIIKDGSYLVFVEVKYRKNNDFGYPMEAVNFSKQRIICRVSDYYRLEKGIMEFTPMRYDVVSILGNEIKWIKNAFEYIPPGKKG